MSDTDGLMATIRASHEWAKRHFNLPYAWNEPGAYDRGGLVPAVKVRCRCRTLSCWLDQVLRCRVPRICDAHERRILGDRP